MVDGQVLGGGEAVVGLDGVEVPGVGDAGPPEGVDHGLAHERGDVGVVLAVGQLVGRAPCGPCGGPSPRGGRCRPATGHGSVGPRRGEALPGQDDARRAVGDLRAVLALDAPGDRPGSWPSPGRSRRPRSTSAGLGVRVALGVGEVDPGDLGQVLVVEAVAALVLVAELAEQGRPRVLDALGLAGHPRGRAEVLLDGERIRGAHQLDAEDQRAVVAPGLDVGHGGQHRHAPRRAGRLVAHRRQAGEGRVGLDQQPPRWPWPQNSSPAKLPTWPTSISPASTPAAASPRLGRLGAQLGQGRALAGQVAGEVGLGPAEDEDRVRGHAGSPSTLRPPTTCGSRSAPAGGRPGDRRAHRPGAERPGRAAPTPRWPPRRRR